jgi:hypothetical protein
MTTTGTTQDAWQKKMPGKGFDNLTLSDLEFQNGQIAKVRGSRPAYMNGDQLISLVRQLGVLLDRAVTKPTPASDAQRLIPGLLGVDNRMRDLATGLQRRGDWDLATYVNREVSALVEIMNTIPPVVDEPSAAKVQNSDPEAAQTIDVPGLVVFRSGEPTTLRNCPPGPFVFDGRVSVKLPEPMQNGNAFAYHLDDGEFFMGGSGGHARDMLIVQPVRLGSPKWVHPAPDDWTLEDTATADEILLLLGHGGSASKEPGADWKRDRIASIIRKRTDAAVVQEREGSAFAVECHSGFGDPASIEACAALVRARGEEQEECIHLQKSRYAAIMEALVRMSDALEKLGQVDPRTASTYRTTMEYAKRIAKGSWEPAEYSPSKEEAPAVPISAYPPKFKVGDEVERTSGGEWLGMEVSDRGVVVEVKATANNWHQIRIDGYYGVYSDFRYKLVKVDA